MKLYTEEQVNQIIDRAYDLELGTDEQMKGYLMMNITPIELPSDEEMGVIALNIASTLKDKLDSREEAFYLGGFQTCNQWIKKQILNQNK